jgi:hypothetical protein
LLFNAFINNLSDVLNSFNCTLFLSLASFFIMLTYMAYSLNSKMEGMYSLKLSVDFSWTSRCFIPKDRIILKHSLEKVFV